MASKDKKPAPKNAANATKVTRITASDTKKPVEKKVANTKASKTTAEKTSNKKSRNGFMRGLSSFGGYFAGAWYELKQVKWPSRKATWSLTAALLAFTAFFSVMILLLDALFQYLFKLMLG